MRKSFIVLLGVLVFGIGAAQAGEENKETNHIFHPYKLKCHYHKHAGKGDKGGDTHCYAKVKLCRFQAPRIESSDLEAETLKCRDELYVECDGRKIWDDGAKHFYSNGAEYVEAKNASRDPALKYPSKTPGKKTESILKVDGRLIGGYCEIIHNAPTLP